MKKLLVTLSFFILVSYSQGQTWESIGSGVADFLISNPKTANRMDEDEQIALGIIGDLLNLTSNRKHEINVAHAGKTQINLQTNSGQKLQLVSDANGKIYVLSNNIIHPISNNVISEAKEYVLNQESGYMDYVRNNASSKKQVLMLPDYNILKIRDIWECQPKTEYSLIKADKTIGIKELWDKYGNNIYTKSRKTYYNFIDCNQPQCSPKQIEKNRLKFKSKNGYLNLYFSHYLYTLTIVTQFKGTFVASWSKDFNNNGSFEFDEFKDIRRNYYENESFVIVSDIYFQYPFTKSIAVMEQLSGNLVYSQTFKNLQNSNSENFYFKSNSLKPGIYMYNISFKEETTGYEIKTISDQFQILSLKENEEINPNSELTIPTSSKEKDTKSKSKEDMINELIKMLKDGIISEETFKVSMKTLEENRK